MEGKEGDNLIGLRSRNGFPGVGALQCATSFGGSSPFSVKAASTASSTLDGLQFYIALRIYEWICEFSSPSLYSLSLRNHRGA